ncbi:MAG: MBL fold metallo-hydrolase [Hyphomicrobiaceae bacterium]|nr:MBL fold metallo-hydrolase [Hyphomicrobiaceae bacterium]MCC0023421.1 MBL fold metallo-hydrolase [Hyphomicrobiaceae bacterium]
MGEATRIIATILGCASSGGVPRVGGNWGTCDPQNPRNRRRRCALLLTGTTEGQDGKTQVLIDTGADMREQLLEQNVEHLDAVFYTHEHADHTHGIDDLRAFALSMKQRVPVFYEPRTGSRLFESFGYCFQSAPGSPYPPILDGREIQAEASVTIEGEGGDITLMPLTQAHGHITSLGFRVGDLMYSCDLSDIPTETLPHLKGLQTWIVDALRPVPHPSHFSLSDALEWIDRVAPERAILTNLHVDMDYEWVSANTPFHVEPAYDGLKVDCVTGERIA